MKEEKLWHLLVTAVFDKQDQLAGKPREEQVAIIAADMQASDFSLQYCPQDERKNFFLAVMQKLNQLKGGTPFPTRYPSAFSTSILAIRKAGYSLEDIIGVLEKKADEWLGTEMQVHFRPKTLFRIGNFENYIAQLNKPSSHESASGNKGKQQSGIGSLLASASAAAHGQIVSTNPG